MDPARVALQFGAMLRRERRADHGDVVGGIALDLARRVDCRLLLLDVLPEPWWAWIGRSREFQPGTIDELLALEPPEGCVLGVGTAAIGAEGFRDSHRQAAAAFPAATADRPIVSYREIAAEALASRDLDAARAFLAAELGPLDAEDRRARILRETLSTYFRCGDNARAAAAELEVHQQTVGQRLETVERLTGSAVRTRRVELELALRLRSYLAARSASAPD